ncbi:hypothetical protein GH714_043230 [Hevea brasiliensis]|uniref:Major facilitator superfamily (MFS) profile domain-containing protein n=1 Tax=Hevea brasiliensis TaxID=3981 RepID=A0A6A6K193_HEVBR|nr:hypothetical protein GH714_043230 [Hevea brasiliensis]
MISDLHIGMVTELNMATTTKSNDWWYDSGATVHVCNDKTQFKNYEEVVNGQKVLMGNHDSAKVVGKGSVELNFTSGKKLLLVNVLYVPEIRKNLVSASLLCKKGYKAVLESDKIIVSINGLFVGKEAAVDSLKSAEGSIEAVLIEGNLQPCWQQFPKRWVIVLLCFMAFLSCNMDRVNMSIAILPMSQEFNWNSATVGLIQSSFFWGCLMTQIFGGIWAHKIGGKLVLGFGVVWWSIATVLTPIAARIGLPFLLMMRAFMGIGEGVAMPAMNNILSKWIPVEASGLLYGYERNKHNYISLLLFSLVLKFNLTESGLFCVFPWLTMALFANIGGSIADTLGSDAFSQSGLYSNHQDIGPPYAGVLLGLSNTAGVLAGVFGTAATGCILQRGSWDDVFQVAVVFYIIGN